MVRGTPHLFGGYLFLWPRRENFEELEGGRKKFIVLNEQLDWSRLRKLWELQGRSDQHFSTTQALFFHNDKHPYFREVHLGVRDSIFRGAGKPKNSDCLSCYMIFGISSSL